MARFQLSCHQQPIIKIIDNQDEIYNYDLCHAVTFDALMLSMHRYSLYYFITTINNIYIYIYIYIYIIYIYIYIYIYI